MSQKYKNNNEKIKERNKKYYKDTKEKIKEIQKKYRKDNKEKIKAQHKEYYEDNKEKIKAQRKKYYEDNKEKIKAQKKKYYEDNKGKLKSRKKEYYEDNKKKIKEIQKKYREDNKDKIKLQREKYREDNKEKIKEIQKKYREDNKEKIKLQREKYREDNKEKIKEYYEDNKEKIKEYHKKYREDNRESLNYKKRIRYYKKRGYKQGDIRVKVHEQDMIRYLEELYPSSEMILGKSIGSECTPKNTHLYPDVQLWCGPYLIVFECDENAHRDASYDCDYARMNRIAISVGCPVWFIRWNPHGNEKIERLGETAQRIINTNSSDIIWTENKQFNVTYIGYNPRQLDRNALRKTIAHHELDTE